MFPEQSFCHYERIWKPSIDFLFNVTFKFQKNNLVTHRLNDRVAQVKIDRAYKLFISHELSKVPTVAAYCINCKSLWEEKYWN